MTYRDDAAALQLRLTSLEREREELHARQRDLRAATARLANLEAELAVVRKGLAAQQARRTLPLLARARVASPCTMSWNDMVGDDRVRHCGKCDKDVYNVAFMTRDEAEALLGQGEVCARLYRRADGTVMTSDCPVGARRKRRRQSVVALALGSGVAAGALYAASHSGDVQRLAKHVGIEWSADAEQEPVMGMMVVDPPTR